MQAVQISVGPCLRGHKTWAGLQASLQFVLNFFDLRVELLVGNLNVFAPRVNWIELLTLFCFRIGLITMQSSFGPSFSLSPLFSDWGECLDLRLFATLLLLGEVKVGRVCVALLLHEFCLEDPETELQMTSILGEYIVNGAITVGVDKYKSRRTCYNKHYTCCYSCLWHILGLVKHKIYLHTNVIIDLT